MRLVFVQLEINRQGVLLKESIALLSDGSSFSWLKSAKGYNCGTFGVWVPTDKSNASCIIVLGDRKSPIIYIADTNMDGSADVFTLFDAKLRSVSTVDNNLDGKFDELNLMTGVGDHSLFFTDFNLDGTYNVRLGPEYTLYTNANGKWELYRDKDNPQSEYTSPANSVTGKPTESGGGNR